MNVIWNGEIAKESDLPALNRGMLFGDGVFETIIVENNKPRFADLHLKRLSLGCTMLGLEIPNIDESIFSTWLRALGANKHQIYRAKLVVWREGTGTYTPESSSSAFLFYINRAPKPHIAIVDKLAISQDVFVSLHSWSSCKTLSALTYVLASKEKSQRGLDELILLNQNGQLAECTASNLFWLEGNTLFTPSLLAGCLAGVMRHVVIEHAKTIGLSVEMGLFESERLDSAELIFVTNVAAVKVFSNWNNKQLYTRHPLFEMLGLEMPPV